MYDLNNYSRKNYCIIFCKHKLIIAFFVVSIMSIGNISGQKQSRILTNSGSYSPMSIIDQENILRNYTRNGVCNGINEYNIQFKETYLQLTDEIGYYPNELLSLSHEPSNIKTKHNKIYYSDIQDITHLKYIKFGKWEDALIIGWNVAKIYPERDDSILQVFLLYHKCQANYPQALQKLIELKSSWKVPIYEESQPIENHYSNFNYRY